MKPIQTARWARPAWLLTTFLLGGALLLSGWAGQRRMANAVTTLSRGQGEDLLDHARQRLRGASPDSIPVEAFLEEQREAGLRYIGVFEGSRTLLAEAGEPLGERRPPMAQGRDDVIDLGGRYRHFGMLPRERDRGTRGEPPAMPFDSTAGEGRPPPAVDSASARAAGRPIGDSLRSRERGPPTDGPRLAPGWAVVIEYEPVLAQAFARDARQGFALSVMVAAVLLGASFGYWRLSVRHEAAQLRLEQQNRLGMLGEMSAVLAHEIRNPLASLKGNAQLLSERLPANSNDRRKADRIVQEAQRLESLTTDLLDFARSGPIAVQPTEPAALIEASAQDVAPGGFVIRSENAPAQWPLDARRMQQAVTNVLRNARQASPEGTTPEVTIAQEDGTLVIAVRDFGAGIPHGMESRIFTPFFTTRTSGTGLGLAVARRVAEMHHGSISAGNHPQGGAVFRLTIPRS